MISPRRQIGWLVALLVSAAAGWSAAAQRDSAAAALIIQAAPQTIIWVDALRYGAVPASSTLAVKNLRAGAHTIRARLKGKREITQNITLAAGEQAAATWLHGGTSRLGA